MPNSKIISASTDAVVPSAPLLEKIVELLNQNPNMINAPYENGKTLLHLAIEEAINDKGAAFKLILNQPNINFNVRDNENNTPLHYAVKYNNINIVEDLIMMEAESILGNNQGLTPLDSAVGDKYYEIIEYMLEVGISTPFNIDTNDYHINMLLKAADFADEVYDNDISPTKEDYLLYAPYKNLIMNRITYCRDTNIQGPPISFLLIKQVFEGLDNAHKLWLEVKEFADKIYYNTIIPSKKDYINYAPYQQLIADRIFILTIANGELTAVGRAIMAELTNTKEILLETEEFVKKIHQNIINPSREDYQKYAPYKKFIIKKLSSIEQELGPTEFPEFVQEILDNLDDISSEQERVGAKKIRKTVLNAENETSWVNRINQDNIVQDAELGL